jgi:hypothetical protein
MYETYVFIEYIKQNERTYFGSLTETVRNRVIFILSFDYIYIYIYC